jgi:hypothetical protein
MTQQMHLVVITETGHILAAVAETVAAGDPTVEALVGEDLEVMVAQQTGATSPLSTLVPADLLEVKTVAYDSAVLANPQSHVVDGGRVARIPPSAAATVIALTHDTITLTKTVPDVPVTVILASSADPTVERRAQSGRFGADATLALTHAILPGDTPAAITTGVNYDVLIAYAGRRLEWAQAAA